MWVRVAPATVVALLLIMAVGFASAFTYYPLTMTATPQAPGVVFQAGSNANQPDITVGKTIEVGIGENSTRATVRIHPTYQENYYRDVLRVHNGDSKAMNVYLIVYSLSNGLPQGSQVKALFYQGNNRIATLDLTSPTLNSPMLIGQLPGGATWQVDFYVSVTGGTSIEGASYSVEARLVYTPSGEAPPANPAQGR